MSRAPWSVFRARVTHGAVPEIGDELRTVRGRRYQVVAVKDCKPPAVAALDLLALPPEAEVQGRVIAWSWDAPRTRRRGAW
jgi:hypothetical protein